MGTILNEMKKAKQRLDIVCECYESCVNCPLEISVGECVLTKLCSGIKKQELDDPWAKTYKER